MLNRFAICKVTNSFPEPLSNSSHLAISSWSLIKSRVKFLGTYTYLMRNWQKNARGLIANYLLFYDLLFRLDSTDFSSQTLPFNYLECFWRTLNKKKRCAKHLCFLQGFDFSRKIGIHPFNKNVSFYQSNREFLTWKFWPGFVALNMLCSVLSSKAIWNTSSASTILYRCEMLSVFHLTLASIHQNAGNS